MSITPPTSNTMMRAPGVSIAAFSDPGPSGASVVTRRILPPRPPGVCAAGPTAPGQARGAATAAIAEPDGRDRKSDEEGKSVSVRVGPGGRRKHKKKKKNKNQT